MTRRRNKTLSRKVLARTMRSERRLGLVGVAPEDLDEAARERPRFRAECPPHPCPFATCRYHLAVDVTAAGSLLLNFPERAVEDMPETCALDVAARGGLPLREVGQLLNVTRARVEQIERQALAAVAAALETPVSIQGRPRPPSRLRGRLTSTAPLATFIAEVANASGDNRVTNMDGADSPMETMLVERGRPEAMVVVTKGMGAGPLYYQGDPGIHRPAWGWSGGTTFPSEDAARDCIERLRAAHQLAALGRLLRAKDAAL